ncbi:hypothetical protein NDU88_008717 [Pleurodeles waltl]|uniref:Uncharacterized protein n=1 Tax=Pleurodeles waltl TaxID=8319 RepID=A0AAV7NX34_PLEWA|nr:hypothetical protein NDU88_008717 [Pleurodeles waltl]
MNEAAGPAGGSGPRRAQTALSQAHTPFGHTMPRPRWHPPAPPEHASSGVTWPPGARAPRRGPSPPTTEPALRDQAGGAPRAWDFTARAPAEGRLFTTSKTEGGDSQSLSGSVLIDRFDDGTGRGLLAVPSRRESAIGLF